MPGGNKNIRGSDGNTFSSTNQPAYRPGRPVKVFSAIAKEFKERGIEKATPEAVREAYEYLLALPLSEILDISGSPKVENDMPSLMRLAAKEMTGKRGIEILREMLDRSHGKARQSTDLTTGGESLNSNPFDKLDPQRRAEILAEITKANMNKHGDK